MKYIAFFALSFLAAASLVTAEFVQKTVLYELDGTQFEGTLIYEKGSNETELMSGIVMIPNWMGPSENAFEKARMIAGDDYAVFVADMYGVGVRPSNSSEAGQAAGFIRNDRELMRARAQNAIDVFHALAPEHPINADKTIAIGFCFGGGTVLELARSGTQSVQGVVSCHGDLKSPTLAADAKQIKIPLLVLHGAADPYVPQADVAAFIAAMQDGDVEDWTLVQFSGAVHSFTNPEANTDGSRYHARTAQRAFEILDAFAEELIGD